LRTQRRPRLSQLS